MDSEAYGKAQQYAKQKYFASVASIQKQCANDLASTQADLASKGLTRSGAWDSAIAKNKVQSIRLCVQAMVDALLDGYELYGVSIDDRIAQSIISEAQRLHSSLVIQVRNAAAQGISGMGRGGSMSMSRELQTSSVPMNEIKCQIAERQVKSRMTPKASSITNVYHLSGANSRINVNSTDQSLNVVTTTTEHIFVELRKQLEEHVRPEEQAEVLSRLDELERAQATPTFAQKYTAFISATANYMTIVSPFIPALTEMLGNALR